MFDRRAATLHRPGATLGHDHLGPALATDVNFTKLVSHLFTPEFAVYFCDRSSALEKWPALLEEGPNALRPVGGGL